MVFTSTCMWKAAVDKKMMMLIDHIALEKR